MFSSGYTCTASPLMLSAFLTARLCLVILCFKVLPVSPMYTLPHSQGILYTTPLMLIGSVGVLTFVKQCLIVRVVLKTVLIFRSFTAFSTSSLSPRMYGRYRVSVLYSFFCLTHCLLFPFVEEPPGNLLWVAIGYKHIAKVFLLFGDIVSPTHSISSCH